MVNSLPPWEIFHVFSCLLIFFQNQLFRKILSGIPSECQPDLIQIRPDVLSGLIWVQSVCKGELKLLEPVIESKYRNDEVTESKSRNDAIK